MTENNQRPEPDALLVEIADYVHDYKIDSDISYQTAHLSLLDSLGCAILAQNEPACMNLLGPIVPGTKVPLGSRVPGTTFELDPVKAAFDIGTCIRWLDYNDTWLAEEWGHPSDNLGGILAVADFLSREGAPLIMHDVLTALIKAYEIQGILALNHAFNRVGLDHVILVKVATTAVVSKLLDLSKSKTIDALSQAWVDGQSLRTYRHAPNTGSRKSWAAGDATSRAVRLALLVHLGEPGIPSALSVPKWGFSDVYLGGKSITLAQPLKSYVMENILYKVAFPAEFHAQTAVEAAIQLSKDLKKKLENSEKNDKIVNIGNINHVNNIGIENINKIEKIEKIEIMTQESGMRIINKEGPLYNYADRDHCIQYMVAIGLLFGELKEKHYSDETAKDPRIDALRKKMIVKEDPQFSKDYLDPEKRAIPNSVQIFFKEGTHLGPVLIEYPLGHPRRRKEAKPLLKDKYRAAIEAHFTPPKKEELITFWEKPEKCMHLPVHKFMHTFTLL